VASASWIIAYRSLQENLTREFTDKGSAIANSLSSSAADLVVNRDASTVQAQVDEFAKISGVAYVMVYDPQRALIAHTFAPVVPKGIIEKNVVPGQASRPQVQELIYQDPRGGREREIIDIGVPMLGGRLGTVRVGMDKSIIVTAAVGAGNFLLLVLGAIAAAAVLAMIPLTRSDFFGPMAVAMMGGLVVATVLTVVFLPALYAAWFRVRRAAALAPRPVDEPAIA